MKYVSPSSRVANSQSSSSDSYCLIDNACRITIYLWGQVSCDAFVCIISLASHVMLSHTDRLLVLLYALMNGYSKGVKFSLLLVTAEQTAHSLWSLVAKMQTIIETGLNPVNDNNK